MNIKKKKSFELIIEKINYYKLILLIIFFFVKFYYNKRIKFFNSEIIENYSKINLDLNLNLFKNLNKKINLGVYSFGLKNGGRARLTSILINSLYNIQIINIDGFNKICLFTILSIQDKEYLIPKDTKRMVIKKNSLNYLNKIISKNKIDILIYNLNSEKEINFLNCKIFPKIIYYQHTSFFYMMYYNYTSFLSLYEAYQKSKYIVSLIPLENNYIFNFWGISSYLMNSFVTYEYNSVIPSNLMSKTILMIGRGNDKYKRFILGVNAMEYIMKENTECEMKIISNMNYDLQNKIYNLNLEEHIKFIGFTLIPEIHFENASLHIFPTISESFGLVLSETKIYGIPNILVGLDYVQISQGGTIIIYDDSPESIAKESIKIMKDENYRKYLGKSARNSMKKFNNRILYHKWVNLILSIYNGDIFYSKLKNQEKKLNENDLIKSLEIQIKLLQKRVKHFYNISINDFKNFSNLYKFQMK